MTRTSVLFSLIMIHVTCYPAQKDESYTEEAFKIELPNSPNELPSHWIAYHFYDSIVRSHAYKSIRTVYHKLGENRFLTTHPETDRTKAKFIEISKDPNAIRVPPVLQD